MFSFPTDLKRTYHLFPPCVFTPASFGAVLWKPRRVRLTGCLFGAHVSTLLVP